MLARLGRGDSVASVAAAAGLARPEFDAWWRAEAEARVPPVHGTRRTADVHAEIHRDSWGIPHIHAATDEELFFAFGYAMAQDRLFQLDYLRRKASRNAGRGPRPGRARRFDTHRPHGRAAAHRRGRVGTTARRDPGAARGVRGGHQRRHRGERRRACRSSSICSTTAPEPWSPVDCLAIEGEFRWYLTVRFPVIVMPELVKRALGRRAALPRPSSRARRTTRASCPPGPTRPPPAVRIRRVAWSAGRRRSATKGWAATTGWWPGGARATRQAAGRHRSAHRLRRGLLLVRGALSGGSFDVAGIALRRHAGRDVRPHTGRVAWGGTNNICSQRDLYQEKTDPAHPGCFLYDGTLGACPRDVEEIQVGAGRPVRKTIRFSRNGPIVDEVLPPAARGTGPVAAPWLGATEGGWLTALLAHGPREVDRASSARPPGRMARADVLRRPRRRRGPHRLPGDRPDPDPARVGARLPPGLGPTSTSGTA